MRKSELQDQIHDTWNVLAHTYRLIGRLWNKELNEFAFSREQGLNLLIIKCLGDNATPYRISRFQAQEHNTVSELLNRMEKQGLIKKVRESQGKSRVKVRLTEMGERAFAQSKKRNSLIRILSTLSPGELQQLRLILEKLRDEVLKEFEKDQAWPEIRIPPSQWEKSDLFNKPIDHRSVAGSKSRPKGAQDKNSKRGRPRKTPV